MLASLKDRRSRHCFLFGQHLKLFHLTFNSYHHLLLPTHNTLSHHKLGSSDYTALHTLKSSVACLEIINCIHIFRRWKYLICSFCFTKNFPAGHATNWSSSMNWIWINFVVRGILLEMEWVILNFIWIFIRCLAAGKLTLGSRSFKINLNKVNLNENIHDNPVRIDF